MFDSSALDVATSDLPALSDDALRALVHRVDHQLRRLEALRLATLAEFDRRDLAKVDGAKNTANWLKHKLGHSGGEAHRAAARAEIVDLLPEVANQLAEGDITTAHLDGLTKLRNDHTDEVLVANQDDLAGALRSGNADDARRNLATWSRHRLDPADKANRQHQQRAVTSRVDVDGMGVVEICGPPELHREIQLHLRQVAKELWSAHHGAGATVPPKDTPTHRQLLHDATMEIIRRSKAWSANGFVGKVPVSADVMVIMDADTARGATDDDAELDGVGPIAADTARRLACICGIIGTAVHAKGQTLAEGRRKRAANRSQRRALKAEYGGCAHPRCDAPFEWCEMHHVRHWEHGGHTDLDNLIPLCSAHHHLVHEGGWRLEHEHQHWHFIAPDGITLSAERRTHPEHRRRRPPSHHDRQLTLHRLATLPAREHHRSSDTALDEHPLAAVDID